jgi:hypothetical protein
VSRNIFPIQREKSGFSQVAGAAEADPEASRPANQFLRAVPHLLRNAKIAIVHS